MCEPRRRCSQSAKIPVATRSYRYTQSHGGTGTNPFNPAGPSNSVWLPLLLPLLLLITHVTVTAVSGYTSAAYYYCSCWYYYYYCYCCYHALAVTIAATTAAAAVAGRTSSKESSRWGLRPNRLGSTAARRSENLLVGLHPKSHLDGVFDRTGLVVRQRGAVRVCWSDFIQRAISMGSSTEPA